MGVLRSFCRSLKLHKRASSLAWRRRRRTEGVLLWKTTSFLCFHIAQQHKWMKLWWWSREIVGGEWSRRGKWPSESLQYVRQGCSRMRWLLGIWTKCDLSLHQLSDIHTSQVALVTIFFFSWAGFACGESCFGRGSRWRLSPLGVRRGATYLGELDEAELWRILYRSPVFIFPSGSNSLSGLLNWWDVVAPQARW
jgi:hypothetical protein